MIELLGVFFVGFYAGWKLREYRAMLIVRAIEKQYVEAVDEIKLLHVEITHHDGVYIAHNKTTNQFVLQGTSYKDVIHQLQAKFPDTNIMTNPVD